jgi:hypothetical protein
MVDKAVDAIDKLVKEFCEKNLCPVHKQGYCLYSDCPVTPLIKHIREGLE